MYYQLGVGADEETGKGIGQSGWGTGVTSNVRSAYGFLCNNYDYGDEIYITGFSRGAFTARSVAGLIGKCGLLTKKGLDLFYETVIWYRNWHDFTNDNRPPCPVSETVGFLMFFYVILIKKLTSVRLAQRGSMFLRLVSRSKSARWVFGIQ